ncbi:MAG: hypothetical protein LBU79_05215 [Planctomycetota bacterium]|jgi:hypothetical protein|nr:hypothetical protein [Planctomycetota bacterium]
MPSSNVKKIDSQLDSLEPGSLRHQVLLSLRQFRASWVELGRLLNEVVYGGDYKTWGYDDFEVYCARELGLKKPTVQKLLVSYNYMKKYEGKRLQAFEEDTGGLSDQRIPDFQTVELLDKARQDDRLSRDTVKELHRKAFDDAVEGPELRRELRQSLRAPDAAASEVIDATSSKRDLVVLLRLARELRRKLSLSEAVPAGLKERIERSLVELEALQ